jgi:glycine hydroxymethyltransferase
MLNAVAAKAVCLKEAARPDFVEYAKRVLDNARMLAHVLIERGFDVISGGTDTPIVLVDLRRHGVTGAAASDALEGAGLIANKNGVPGDTQPPTITSGLRFGTSSGSARGFSTVEFQRIAHLIADVLLTMLDASDDVTDQVRAEVRSICDRFPIYP